jgi:hypothetical protein
MDEPKVAGGKGDDIADTVAAFGLCWLSPSATDLDDPVSVLVGVELVVAANT